MNDEYAPGKYYGKIETKQIVPLKKKIIQVEIELNSSCSDYVIKEFVEQIILSSVINSTIYNGKVNSVKVEDKYET